jgi:hypothetical protein
VVSGIAGPFGDRSFPKEWVGKEWFWLLRVVSEEAMGSLVCGFRESVLSSSRQTDI